MVDPLLIFLNVLASAVKKCLFKPNPLSCLYLSHVLSSLYVSLYFSPARTSGPTDLQFDDHSATGPI